MVPAVQTENLYDFLYRDSSRIASYSAQVFSGLLSSVEETDASRKSLDKTGKAGVAVLSGEVKHTGETATGAKRVFTPHDLIVSDVLNVLLNHGRVGKDVRAAAHGSLVMTQGTLLWVDRHILELALSIFDAVAGSPIGAVEAGIISPDAVQFLPFLKGFLEKLDLPSAFLLMTGDGLEVVGTIKDEGMEEPISTYYFKHGNRGLSDVYLIGIKEIPTQSVKLPDTGLLGVGQQASQALCDMLFPAGAVRVTPIALFRKL